MTEQPTLQQILNARIEAFVNSDKPTEIIDAGVEKLFKEVIQDAFRSYGDMGAQVKTAIQLAMPANVSDMVELARYNDLIAKALKDRWESSCNQSQLLVEANKAIDSILIDEAMPAQISLRDLLETFIEEHKEQAAENHWESPDIRIMESEYGGYHIYFDEEPADAGRRHGRERSDFELKNAIHVSFENTSASETSAVICRAYSAKIDGKKIRESLRLYGKYERLIAALYFGNSTLVIDCDPDDFSYGLYD